MNSHRHDEETRHALRAAISGAAAAFVVVSVFEVLLFLVDLRGLGRLLQVPASELSLWHLVWLPACCAVAGFAMGPSVAGPPAGRRLSHNQRSPKTGALFAALMAIGIVLWMVAAWSAGRTASQRMIAAAATCGPALTVGCDPLIDSTARRRAAAP